MNNGIPERIQDLIVKHLTRKLSEAEKVELDQWLDSSEKNRLFFSEIENREELKSKWKDYNEISEDKVWRRISNEVPEINLSIASRSNVHKCRRIAVAAAVIAIIAVAGWYFLTTVGGHNYVKKVPVAASKNDVPPGRNRAVLTLADGSKIVLDSAQNGSLAKQGNTAILKQQDLVTYKQDHATTTNAVLYNTLSTPRGGQYHVILPDGSKVWLNSASSIHFPVYFTSNERKVEVSGEAYFEIVKDKLRPFKVTVSPNESDNRCEIEVLGTHFNVNAYSDEDYVKTTLLEGKIRLTPNSTTKILNTKVLNLGQQAILNKDESGVKVINPEDAESAIAWMKGIFHFEKANINDVMRQISRWYDVKIIYEGNISKQAISGDAERNIPLSRLLEKLEKMDAGHFVIQERTVKVMP